MILLKKSKLLKIAATVLAIATLLSLASCAQGTESDTTPIYECGDEKLPLFFYEFMLSRAKGTLARNKYDVKDPEFWTTVIEGDGRTYEEFYNDIVLDSCKNYFAAALIFDAEGLTLSESALADIDEEVAYYIDYDGDGDESEFNAIIDDFGIDAKALRECYIIEAKYNYVVSYLYGGGELIGDAVKDEYYKANYHRFKQILLRNYYYEYEYDSQGNLMYFDDDSGKPIYDTKNGTVKYDDGGMRIRDSFGEIIYYDKDGKIIYDTVKGKPAAKLDGDGNAIKYEYTEEQLAERLALAQSISDSIAKGDVDSFEAKLKEINADELIFEAYPDGYYLSRTESNSYVGYSYIIEILDALEDMEVGEIDCIESEFGYHVIMKYQLDSGRYNDGEYADWFNDFTDNILAVIPNVMSDII